MTYQEKVSFDGKLWYQLEWENVNFRTFENTEGVKDSKSIEELENIVAKAFPNSNFKSTFIGKRK